MDAPDWQAHAEHALQEDRASEDVTTRLIEGSRDRQMLARFRGENRFVLAGLPMVEAVFHALEPDSVVVPLVGEGEVVPAGEAFAEARASAAAILAGERVALNFLQRLSGIASITRRAVEAVAGSEAVVTDTRKTTPGIRDLEKYAVRVGGGVNHRLSLADAILWKDNHWRLLESAGELAPALEAAPAGLPVCVEVESDEQLDAALAAGVTWILADNRHPDVVCRWVSRCGPEVTIEASGGITPETAAAYAAAGAQRISIGALTYAPDQVTISLELENV
jgi:nicotinate-nucleotide pyrophosphorylase (carboxylating)